MAADPILISPDHGSTRPGATATHILRSKASSARVVFERRRLRDGKGDQSKRDDDDPIPLQRDHDL